MNIARLLEDSANRSPHKKALLFEGHSYTYGELNQLSARFARGLHLLGIRKGDICVLMMQNSPEFIIAYYGIARLGAIVLPINFLFKVHELSHIFSDSRPKAFIGIKPFVEEPILAMENVWDIPTKIIHGDHKGFVPFEDLLKNEPLEIQDTEDDDVLAILYTSGTTGVPKGAMLSHGNLRSNAITVATMRETDPDDIVLGVLPLYHVYGQTSAMNSSIYLGLTIELFRHFDPEKVIDSIERNKSTILIAVPTMYNRLVQVAKEKGLKRSSLRFCISGGASLPVEILHQFQEIFQTTIYEGYGLTECSPVCVENPFGKKTKPGSIGVPIPGFEAKIVDEQGKEVKAREVGELIVRGPGVMKGYLNREEDTMKAIKSGWLYTGDMAYKDEEGYIFIVDRKKDMIIRGGYNVYPREIEEILFQHPMVIEAGVYGVPHPDLGEEVAADVVVKGHVSPDELKEFVKARVAPYKYPRIVNIVQDLPKSHTGKVLKKELKERWLSQKKED